MSAQQRETTQKDNHMKLLILLPASGLVIAIVGWFVTNILPQLQHILNALPH